MSIDAIFAPLREEVGIRGMVVGARAGTFEAVRAYGSFEREEDAFDETSRFQIASITKTFVAIALADAIQRGEVAASDPVERYLPVAPAKPITLEALATHTSGLPYFPPELEEGVEHAQERRASYTPEEMYAAAARPLDPSPLPAYSNMGYALLAIALAAVAETTVPELIASRVCAPLGLEETSYEGPTVPGIVDGNVVPPRPVGIFWGATGLRSSARDMLRYARAQLRPDDTPLGPAIRAAHLPRLLFSSGQDIGLGWVVSTRDPPVIWHNGGAIGSGAFVGVCLRTQRALVALYTANQQASVDLACLRWLRAEAHADPLR